MMTPEKPCEYCWETFEPKRFNVKYCSEKCKKAAYRDKAREQSKQHLKNGSSKHYLNLRFLVFRRDDFRCIYCGRSPQDEATLHVDHVIPRSKGGTLAIDNLVTSCSECNLGKRDVVLTAREVNKIKKIISDDEDNYR